MGDGDGVALSQLVQAALRARIDAHRLVVDGRGAGQVIAVLGVEGLQVRPVLEVVGVQAAVVEGLVGQDIVGVLHDLQLIALGLDLAADGLQYLRVRRDGRAHRDHLVALAPAARQGPQHSTAARVIATIFFIFVLPFNLIM